MHMPRSPTVRRYKIVQIVHEILASSTPFGVHDKTATTINERMDSSNFIVGKTYRTVF